jgi:hypothetical protein
MKVNNNNKKGSNAKKIIPAVGMLSVSAVMLASSTFAWFTMSREVEVKNISMTATVPEDIQISLGHLTSLTSGKHGYVDNDGILDKGSNGSADNNLVAAPLPGNTQTDMLDWSNTVDFSQYYALGRIIPASSVSGENIYFTPNADGVGQTIKANPDFYTAASGKTAQKEDRTGAANTDLYRTTLHAYTGDADKAETTGWLYKESGGYTVSEGWNKTNDDGYYVDIPVWLRTSSTKGSKLSVDAYVIPKTLDISTASTTDVDPTNELYKAVRVAIVPEDTATTNETGVNKLLLVKDGYNASTKQVVDAPWSQTGDILDFYKRNVSNGAIDTTDGKDAVKAVASNKATYDSAVKYTANECVVDLTASGVKGTGTGYGAAKKYYVRVWLEGEDPQCWNANAGQDFTVNLKFTNLDTAAVPSGT